MLKKKKLNFRIKATMVLLMILMTTIYMNFLTNNSNNTVNSEKIDDEPDDPLNPFKTPKVSTIKFDQWWNTSFTYRRLINITNNHDVNLTDTWTLIQFNYADLVAAGKLNESLKDVRIIENDIEREYYIEKDYPSTNLATVYFRNNCTNNTIEMDTYLYYSNNSVNHGSTLVNYNPYGINWYRFEDGSGITTTNEMGQYDGTLVNMEDTDWKSTSASDPDQLGNYYLEFDGGGGGSLNEYLYIQDQYMYGAESIPYLTMSCWFRTMHSNPYDFDNWAFFDFDRSEFFNFFIYADTGEIGFSTSSPSRATRDFRSATPGLNDGAWHFAMVSYNKDAAGGQGTKTVYVDGVAVPNNTATNVHLGEGLGRADSGDEYRYGFVGDGSEADWENGGRNNIYYDGDLDEVRYFNWSIDQKEREQVFNNYQLDAALNDEHANMANIEVTVIGMDNEHIPDVIITLNQTSSGSYAKRQTANSLGISTFTSLDITPIYYNFTVTMNSSIHTNLQETINVSAPILFTEFYTEIDIICNVSTVEFVIDDVDNKPVESGWVIIGNKTGEYPQLQNCSIDETGKARFWWLDDTIYNYDYNYTVYYKNADYYPLTPSLNTIILGEGDITDLRTQTTINVKTNLTTVNFDVRRDGAIDQVIEGAELYLYENISLSVDRLIAKITTDDEGNATLRWVNSSTQLGYPGFRNYTLQIYFWGFKLFEIPVIKPIFGNSLDFEVSNAVNYTVILQAVPEDYEMELISLNPTDNLFVDWGTEVTLRYLLNETKYEGWTTNETTPLDADSMTFIVEFGAVSLLGSLYVEIPGSGRHVGVIDTSQLSIVVGSQTTYDVTITAQKAGFQSVQNIDFDLTVIKNDVILNQSENDDSTQSEYWLKDINMTVQPYGENSEVFIIENSIFTETNDYMTHNFNFSIPDLSTDWNLSYIIFNIYNVEHGQLANIQLNITDLTTDKKYTWDNTSTGYYYYPEHSGGSNGTWINLLIPLNKESLTNNNTFSFQIDGTFTSDTVDVVAEAYFLRNKINTKYSLFNITDDISIVSDGNGWVIKNITFELYNCRDSSWNLIDPSTAISMISTNDGYNYTFDLHALGSGKIIIDNITIYPLDDQFLFEIIKSNSIIFDVNITVEYYQGFYWNQHLELISTTKTEQGFTDGGVFSINFDDELSDQGAFLLISDINNGIDNFNPTEIGMNITFITLQGAQTIDIGDLGIFSLVGYNKDMIYSAYIQANTPVNFTLTFIDTYSRTVYYEVTGTVTYVATSTVYGPVPYDTDLECYLLTLDTSDLNAQAYTIVFTYSSDYYETTIKNLNIDVLERITLLNGREDIVTTIVSTIFVQDAVNFTFSYIDRDLNDNITDLKTQSYTWKRFSNGIEVDDGSGTLTINANKEYVLDFNTETKQVGRYTLTVTLDKDNYEIKIATITLTIEKREIDYDLGSMFDGKQVSVVKGKTITIEIELTDPTRGDKAIKGAKVVLEIGDDELEFDEKDDGVYELKFDTEDYKAFFTSNILTGTIKISKSNYTSEEVDITIVIQMEEIIEGVPTFYFIMVVGAVAAVVGSLVTYRVIQLAKIPKFIKKARAMKKAIKGRGEIPNSALTSSKEEMILKQFGNEWKELGLSLEDTLGIKGKKGKTLSNEEGGAK